MLIREIAKGIFPKMLIANRLKIEISIKYRLIPYYFRPTTFTPKLEDGINP